MSGGPRPLPPGAPPVPGAAPPQVVAPAPARLFAARAARLEALATGHSAEPFLRFLARLARGQDAAVREVRIPAGVRAVPGPRPLDAAAIERDASWRTMLAVVLGSVRGADLPAAARDAAAGLRRADAAALEALADAVIAGTCADLAAAPFVGAALQAWFATLAAGLPALPPPEAPGACGACGFPPVASTVRGDDRARLVSCGLCATAWHVPRVRCVSCGAANDVAYFEVGDGSGVKAEACGGCRSYVKVVDALHAPGAEPVADDAASLVLDLLLGEEGWRRAARNLLAPAGEPA